jgi:hypothetical protein
VTLAIGLLASGLGLLGWALAAPERIVATLPLVVGEWALGVWLLQIRSGTGKGN